MGLPSSITKLADSRRWWPALAACALGAATLWWAAAGHAPAPASARANLPACVLPAQPGGAPHPGMVWVPPGVLTGADPLYPEEARKGATPVAGFWMDRTETSNDAFAVFVAATGYVTVAERSVDAKLHPGLPDEMRLPGAVVFEMPAAADAHGDPSQWWRYVPGANWRHPGGPATSIAGHGAYPVVAVTIEDARAYAAWKGRALPTEAQWEWAARAGQPATQEREQPAQANTWQGVFPVLNSGEDGYLGLAPVACYAPNAYGLYDMIGNVWELTADVFRGEPAEAPAAPDQAPMLPGASADARHVIKGGSYLCAPNYCMRYRAGARQPQEDDLAAGHLGFRTVLVAPAPAPAPRP